MHAVASGTLARPSTATRSLLRPLVAPVALVAAMVCLLILVPPIGEFSIGDDWLYAQAVLSLLEHGRLELSPWTAPSLVLQAYWGGLFAELVGFSHTTLRASTLVLSVLASLGCWALLRQVVTGPWPLLGALLLLLNPLYVHLSYTFMTDVPFLCLLLAALACYVRALAGPSPSLQWLVAGSVLAGGAYLVRQLAVVLPVSAWGALLLTYGRRSGLCARNVAAVVGPSSLAVLVGIYIDMQRGPVKIDPLAWTLAFWGEQGAGMAGVLLARLAATFSTLGFFTLPLSLAALVGGTSLGLGRRQRWLAAGLLVALSLGFVLRSAVFGRTILFPHLPGSLYPRGFDVGVYDGTLPESIVLAEPVRLIAGMAALVGGGLLALALAGVCRRRSLRGAAGAPLLFGLFALGLTLSYYQDFHDRYLLPLLPIAFLVVLLGFRPLPGVAPRRVRWSGMLAVAGVLLFAGWSIWWERDYLERRAALWQASLALTERGIPLDDIDGGVEWNGWHHGQNVVAGAVRDAELEGGGRSFQLQTHKALDMSKARWAVAYTRPKNVPAGRVVLTVPYGRGQHVVAVQRF